MRILSSLFAIVVFVCLACQSPQKSRSIASQSDEAFKGNLGTLQDPKLNEEYEVLTTGASPLDESGQPYLDFKGKYGLNVSNTPFASEAEDFADQSQRIHIIQLINFGIKADEIKRVATAGVDFADYKSVLTEINKGRSPRKKISENDFIQKIHRGFHAKAHGCLKADFKVWDQTTFNQELPRLASHFKFDYGGKSLGDMYNSLRHGLFEKPTTYRALVRYSNGTGGVVNDKLPDVRGLAFKLIATADGQALEDDKTKATTQDFLMTNKPNPFGENARQFINFAFANAESPIAFEDWKIKSNRGSLLNFSKRDPRLRQSLADMLGRAVPTSALKLLGLNPSPGLTSVTSLANETYWSGAPYRLGSYAVKFQVKPAPETYLKEGRGFGGDYLRKELKERVRKGSIRYIYFVQFQTDPVATPVEDTLEPWTEAESVPVPVGELVVLGAENTSFDTDARMAECQSLVYDPWHHFSGHKPMSNLNRGRRAVYSSSARYRQGKPEPTLQKTVEVFGPYSAN